MKRILLFILVAAVGLTTACKDEDLTVTLIENGNLQLTLVDNNANLIADAEVTLYQGSFELDELTTTENGLADFGKLNVGSYIAVVEATVNGKEYTFNKGMQVVAGATKQYEANVESYVGDISLQFRNSSDDTFAEVEGLETVLVRKNDAYFAANSLSEYLSLAIATVNSDAQGKVIYENVPVGSYVLIYHDGVDVESSTTVYISKDENEFISFYINVLRAVIDLKADWSVSSLVRESDGSAVTNDYVSIIFDVENSDVTLTRSGGASDISGSYYAGYSGLDFYWNGISSWYADVETVSTGQLVIEYYDYNLGESVIMTLN